MLSRISPIRPKKSPLRKLMGLAGDGFLNPATGEYSDSGPSDLGSNLPVWDPTSGDSAPSPSGTIDPNLLGFDLGGSSSPGIGTSIIDALGKVGSAVLPGLIGGQKAPVRKPPTPGVMGFLTSAPVLIGGGVLVALLLFRRKRSS